VSAFDGIAVGDPVEFGSYEFTAERIKRFARDWDPQAFHMDEAQAAETPFAALCASGWHTASVMMRLQVDYFAAHRGHGLSFGPSPGFDDLKWPQPVYAGDRVTFSGRVVAKRRSRSRPGTGIVTTEFSGVNQNGEAVFSMTAHVFVAAA